MGSSVSWSLEEAMWIIAVPGHLVLSASPGLSLGTQQARCPKLSIRAPISTVGKCVVRNALLNAKHYVLEASRRYPDQVSSNIS